MTLTNLDFIFLSIVIICLPLLMWWANHNKADVLFAYEGHTVHEVYDGEVYIMDELYAELVDTVDGVYIIRVSADLMWLAWIYVDDGVLTPVVRK